MPLQPSLGDWLCAGEVGRSGVLPLAEGMPDDAADVPSRIDIPRPGEAVTIVGRPVVAHQRAVDGVDSLKGPLLGAEVEFVWWMALLV